MVFFVCEILPIIILLDYSYYARILQPDDDIDLAALRRSAVVDAGANVLVENDDERPETERDTLLYHRSLNNTIDHLLLTSPRDGPIIDSRNRLRRVRFVDTPPTQVLPQQTPLLLTENPPS